MAKTVFTEGDPAQQIPATVVTDDFLNAVNNHIHDGLDRDGSAPEIPSRNLLIGGNFSVNPFQRGSGTAVIANGGAVADGWRVEFDGGATITRDVVDIAVGSRVLGVTVKKALKLTLTNKAAASYIRLGQRIESVDTLAGAGAVLSSAIQGSRALAVPVRAVQSFGSGGAPSASVITAGTQQLAVTEVLQEVYADIAIPGIAGKTFGTTANTDYLELQYDLTNLATGDYVIIPLSRLQRGTYPTNEEEADPERTLAQCQRRYAKSFSQGVAPAQNLQDSRGCVYGTSPTGLAIAAQWHFPVEMRVPPTIVTYSPHNASSSWANGSGTYVAAVVQTVSTKSCSITSAATGSNNNWLIHATAEAEL